MNEYLKSFLVSLKLDKQSLKEFSLELEKSVAKSLKNMANSIGNTIKDSITSSFKNAWKEMNNIINYSQLSSAKTRELAFGYGFSASEAYAWDKALSAVGLEGEEDLYYANQQELSQFREAFENYTNKYDELYDSGFFKDLQEYQFEMADFRQEMQMEIIKFFVNNKDLIKEGMMAIMKISEGLLEIFSWLVSVFGDSNKALSTSDIISKYSEVNNTSNNVSVSNNFNGIGKGDEQWLSNMGELTYAQVIKALGG